MRRHAHGCVRGITGPDFTSDLALDDINITDISGINESPLNAMINIYPNPSNNGIFNINVNGIKNQSATFSITDVSGRSVENRKEKCRVL